MRGRTPAAALMLLLATAACSSSDDRLGDDADVPAGDTTSGEEVLVPVERSAELVDPEGSVLGTAWLREADNGTELEVQAAGLTQGFHGMYLFDVASCDAVDPGATGTVLSPVLVLDNGVGSITTLVGSVDLDTVLEGGGPAVVIADAVASPGDVDDAGPGSRIACGAFAE